MARTGGWAKWARKHALKIGDMVSIDGKIWMVMDASKHPEYIRKRTAEKKVWFEKYKAQHQEWNARRAIQGLPPIPLRQTGIFKVITKRRTDFDGRRYILHLLLEEVKGRPEGRQLGR